MIDIINEGKWIGITESNNNSHKPSPCFKKSFDIKKIEETHLYITSHGIYEAYLNGERVGSQYLTPGPGTYNKRLFYQDYNVTPYLKEGENTLLVYLGDGWYRGLSGADGDRNLYGSDIALWCVMTRGDEVILSSDSSFLYTTNTPMRENDLLQGEIFDANISVEDGEWKEAEERDYSKSVLTLCCNLPVTKHESLSGKLLFTPNGETVVDFGQNLAGIISFSIPMAHSGDIFYISAGETLDENGNFTQENFQTGERNKEGRFKQRLVYIAKEGENNYENHFTVWGFRYIRIVTDSSVDISTISFTSHALYSDMKEIGKFSSGDERLNKLFQNALWSMKSNFLYIPTDCPTRERAGWTGDAGVFINTALYLMDSESVFASWLKECQYSQYEDGRVSNIAPKNTKGSMFTTFLAASVGWGDAVIIVPYTLYKRNGNKEILRDNYSMMQSWLSFLKKRSDSSWSLESRLGIDYGEWCEPGLEDMKNVGAIMGKPQYSVSTAYYAHSLELMIEISLVLGKEEESKYYQEEFIKAKKDYRDRSTKDGVIESTHQADYVRPLFFNLLSKEESLLAAEHLNKMIEENNYHLNTGFLSTPFLLPVLCDYGYEETAYKLLLQSTSPSWLYAVEKNATTIWENWDGIDEAGRVKASLNHYSYGSVVSFLFEYVCGIKADDNTIVIAPRPNKNFGHAECEYLSKMGLIKSSWCYVENKIEYSVTVPKEAKFILRSGKEITLEKGEHIFEE